MEEKNSDWLPDFYQDFSLRSMGMIKDLEKCLQCGKCTSVCPAARLSPYSNMKIIRDLVTGNVEEVVSSEEIWECFFCSTCYAVCPRDINFPFVIAMIRYAALNQGYGWDYVKKISAPYAQDYYDNGVTVSDMERNPTITRRRADHSGTDGSIGAIRRKMGMPAKREVSAQGLAEIQFLSDITGMTDRMRMIPQMQGQKPDFRYGNGTVSIKRDPATGKFAGLTEGGNDIGERGYNSANPYTGQGIPV